MDPKFQPRLQFIRQSAVSRRVDALFKAMSTDFLLREQFVTEPSQVLSEYVHASKLAPEQAAASDHLLYSVMSNDNLLSWLREYSIKQGGVVPPRSQFMPDFSRAVVANGGHHVVTALARSSVEKQDVLGIFEAFLPIIFSTFAGGLRAQTEMSTGHTTGTEMSTGHFVAQPGGRMAQTEMSTGHTTGTEMSTGHFVAQPGGRVAQTEMSTGHTTGTEMSTGHFVAQPGSRVAQTEMSTGHTTGTEMSTGHFVGGSIFAQTEASTGTGTMISTGHTTGTEKTTGHIIGSEFFQVGFERVTLAALVDYAKRLRDVGALDMVQG